MAGRKHKMLVAGGVDTKDEKVLARPSVDVGRFAAEVAREVIQQGYFLLNGSHANIEAPATRSWPLHAFGVNDQAAGVVGEHAAGGSVSGSYR